MYCNALKNMHISKINQSKKNKPMKPTQTQNIN